MLAHVHTSGIDGTTSSSSNIVGNSALIIHTILVIAQVCSVQQELQALVLDVPRMLTPSVLRINYHVALVNTTLGVTFGLRSMQRFLHSWVGHPIWD